VSKARLLLPLPDSPVITTAGRAGTRRESLQVVFAGTADDELILGHLQPSLADEAQTVQEF
jgi:hypothetical protein